MNLQTLQAQIRACRLCAADYEIYGAPVFSGDAGARVMLIGQAPGITEMHAQRPFNFTAGTRLFQWLAAAGWDEQDFRARHYMASVTRCYPGKNPKGRGDRVPTPAEQALCAPWRERELALLPQLRLIIPVGKLAIGLFFDDAQPLHTIIGTRQQHQGRLVIPLPHPSGASTWYMLPQNKPLLAQAIAHLRQWREEHDLTP